jgi:cytochrome c-type biogenesis protein CcmE
MKNWKFAILAGGIFALSLSLVLQAKQAGTSLVLTPAQLLVEGEEGQHRGRRIQVVGKISDVGLVFETEPRLKLAFRVADRDDALQSVPVVYYGLKPDMFAPDREVIISGMLEDGVIMASTLQTQCPSKYESPDADAIAAQYIEKKKAEQEYK